MSHLLKWDTSQAAKRVKNYVYICRRFSEGLISLLCLVSILLGGSDASALTWGQFKKWANSRPKSSGSSYSGGSYRNTKPGPTKAQRAKVAAKHYCGLRNSGVSHAHAWDVAYKKVKNGSGLFGAFKMRPTEARDLISGQIIEGDIESCSQYVSDFYPEKVLASSVSPRLSGPILQEKGGSNDASRPTSAQVADQSRQITVKIDGVSQGSGVIIASSEGRTRIITSWHVIQSAAEGEDLYAVTSDGLMHSLQPSSISRIGDVDLATVEFFAQDTYPVAKIPDSEQIVVGQNVYVSGFPLSTATVPVRLYRFLTGDIISYSPQPLDQGYRLLYNNPTLPGMSGGGVFSASGELLAIHGRAETDARLSEQSGVAVKTNTNLGIPLTGYKNAILKSPGELRSISILKK